MNCINEFTCSLVFGEFHQSEVPERDGWTVRVFQVFPLPVCKLALAAFFF